MVFGVSFEDIEANFPKRQEEAVFENVLYSRAGPQNRVHLTIHPIDVIQHKRDGLTLSDGEIQGFIRALVARKSSTDSPTDAQTAALLMAIFLRGLIPQELAALTQAMRFSGEVFNPTPLQAFTVDKHSTGGVGDKTSLLIAPIVAAAGLKAMCLGAQAVLVGRAYAYGLAAAGEPGVARAIEILRADVIRTMKLLGCPSVKALDRSYLDVPPMATA